MKILNNYYRLILGLNTDSMNMTPEQTICEELTQEIRHIIEQCIKSIAGNHSETGNWEGPFEFEHLGYKFVMEYKVYPFKEVADIFTYHLEDDDVVYDQKNKRSVDSGRVYVTRGSHEETLYRVSGSAKESSSQTFIAGYIPKFPEVIEKYIRQLETGIV